MFIDVIVSEQNMRVLSISTIYHIIIHIRQNGYQDIDHQDLHDEVGGQRHNVMDCHLVLLVDVHTGGGGQDGQ